jgi:tetratricopeptide (TPR) repeat protein
LLIFIGNSAGTEREKACCAQRSPPHRRIAGLHHALGLALTRLKRREEALDELRRAAELDPERARYAYVYAVGLHSAGHVDDAMAALKASLARHPGDRDTLLALVSFSRDLGDVATALDTPSNSPAQRRASPASMR